MAMDDEHLKEVAAQALALAENIAGLKNAEQFMAWRSEAKRWVELLFAGGALAPCQEAVHPAPMFPCMKSICDFAADKKDDWQDYAAFTAAELCHRFLIDEWETLFPEPAAPR